MDSFLAFAHAGHSPLYTGEIKPESIHRSRSRSTSVYQKQKPARAGNYFSLNCFSTLHPAPHQIVDSIAETDHYQNQYCDRDSDHDLKSSVTFLVRRRKLILRKVWRRSVHDRLTLSISPVSIKLPRNRLLQIRQSEREYRHDGTALSQLFRIDLVERVGFGVVVVKICPRIEVRGE